MITALSKYGNKIFASSGETGFCPICNEVLVPKICRLKLSHWAHSKSSKHCEHEPETEWHRKWKSIFNINNIEVVVNKHGIIKRTDVMLGNEYCVEFQHSSISIDEINERENFYGKMIWVFDCIDAYNNGRIQLRIKDGCDRSDLRTFRWFHPKKSISYTTKPTYLDLGNCVLRLKKMGTETPLGGYGFLRHKSELVKYFKDNCP